MRARPTTRGGRAASSTLGGPHGRGGLRQRGVHPAPRIAYPHAPGMNTTRSDPPQAATGRTGWLLARLGLSVGVLIALLVPLELIARSRYAERYDHLSLQASEHRPPPAPTQSVTLMDLVQASRFPDMVYELRPSVQARFKSVPYRSNALGMRDAEVSPGKPTDVLRIAFLGDSFTFGWGVEVAQGYADLLEGLLQQRLEAAGDTRRVEVLNFGVPGYNTATEVACLEHKALPLKPDLILLQYFYNDAYLPNFLMPERPRPVSYLVEWVKDAMGLRQPPGSDLVDAGAEGPLVDWRRDPSRVPPELAYMVGTPGIERALQRLVELAGQAGVRVGVVMISLPGPGVVADPSRPVELPAGDQEVRALCGRLGLPVISTLEPTVTLLRASGGTSLDLVLSDKDWHPNPKGHRFFAGLIADGLCDAGLFPPGN